jgi:tetratricopeptide (TPR) repeat protein
LKQFLAEQALLYYNKAYTTALEKKIPAIENARKYSLFNIVLCYKKLKKYDLALQTIKSFYSLKNIEKDILDQMTMLEASIYCEMNNFDKSYTLYQGLLSKENDLNANTLGLTYNNIASLYRKMGDINTAFFYNGKALELKGIIEEKFLSDFLLLSAQCHRALEQTDLAVDLLRKSYDIAVKYMHHEVMLSSLLNLSEIYLYGGNLEEAERQLSYLKAFVEENEIFSKYPAVYALFAEYHLIAGDRIKCTEYLDKIREISLYF